MGEKKNDITFGLRFKVFTIILGCSLIIISLLPYAFTKWSIIDFTNTGQIGDTIGGIMSPFIGIVGAILTFAAFWAQYQANQKQFEILNKQQQNIIKDGVEKPLYFLLDHYFRLESQLIHGERNGKSTFGLFLSEVKYVKELFFKTIGACYTLPREFKDLNVDMQYAIIKISVDWWWEGINKQKTEKEIMHKILKEFHQITLAGEPESLTFTFGKFDQAKELLYTDFLLFIERCRTNSPVSLDFARYENPGVPRSHLLSAYFKAVYNILFYINDSDHNVHDLEEKQKWVKYFIELLSDEELELLSYVTLSKVLFGLELDPKQNESHLKGKNEEVRRIYWINRMLVSKYNIFDTLFRRQNPDESLDRVYYNHTLKSKVEQLDFEYDYYKQIWGRGN